jgi:2-iminobutanoate/2-iminopropanoate deaminase
MLEAVVSEMAPRPIGPYSQAIAAGGFLFLSGQIPLSPTTGEVVGDTAARQAQQVMENLQAVLSAAGAAASDVVKTTIFLTDLSDFSAVNEVYGEVFGASGAAPARSTVQVAALPRGVRVEIEAVAQLPVR